MNKTRLALANIYWYTRAALENAGLTTTDKMVRYGYPAKLEDKIFPIITVDKYNVVHVPVEIGGADHKKVSLTIDVFGNSDSQRDELSDIIQDYFSQKYFRLYDFTNGFPTIVGDYTGIASLGNMFIQRVDVINMQPPTFTEVVGEKYHDLIVMDIILP